MKIAYSAHTDVGRKRKGNEDSLFVNPEQNLFVVADGMGGHAAGEVASRVAVESINEFVCMTSGDEQLQGGMLTAEQARSHPLRNVVTRALGGKPDLDVEMQVHEALPGDVLLLCSDGLTTMVPDPEIERLLVENGGVETAAKALVDE